MLNYDLGDIPAYKVIFSLCDGAVAALNCAQLYTLYEWAGNFLNELFFELSSCINLLLSF